ncbi:hypothetical protein BDA99DRAFT_295540 [Phascolomyces articulosus]|uniref:Uncharacterized protein n=1 Tax=Phascolomyces articulosus TaxID=60185 RepID=A0AAD5JXS1_9FUNG|nr:hypothetical protein BDA99DRAFT_295540 [Phascolomyces articulosus]
MIELPPPSPALLLQEQWNNNTDKRRRRRKRHRQQQLRWDEELILVSMIMILLSQSSYQQDEDGDGYDDTDDTDETDDTDDCSLISGHTCNANGICKYCAMCLQSSCILSKSISPNTNNTSIAAPPAPVCNTTQFGTTDIYEIIVQQVQNATNTEKTPIHLFLIFGKT